MKATDEVTRLEGIIRFGKVRQAPQVQHGTLRRVQRAKNAAAREDRDRLIEECWQCLGEFYETATHPEASR